MLVPVDVRVVGSFLVGGGFLAAGMAIGLQAVSALGACVMAGALAVPLVGFGRSLG